MTREQACFYLAGIIDGEGHVMFRESKGGWWERGIVVGNTDRAIIDAVVECCDVLEYDYTICKRQRQNSRWKACWQVKLCGADNLNRMVVDLPLRSSDKLATLKASLATVKRMQLSGRQKRMVDALLSEGVKTRKIAAVIGCDQRTIQYRKQRLAKEAK